MKQACLTFLLILFTAICSAQKLSDKFEYKVTYKLTYKLDSTNLDESRSEYMILFAGDELSKFSSRAITIANPIERRGNTGQISRTAITAFHYNILKDRYNNKLLYTKNIVHDQFYYTQEIDLFDWKIQPETKKIEDYKVQRATTSFAGRDYAAWFTTEIPIPEGPYKFSGLPGLILEIVDSKNHYGFEFIGLEKLAPKLRYTLNLRQYHKIEKQRLKDIWYTYRKDPQSYTNNPDTKTTPEDHRKLVELFAEKLKKENNPIELE